MKVSIVTICYNAANTIERTIKSVLSQDYPDIEYIIVDGGSTDGTVDIIRRYENRISAWISEKDEGISDAFNKGIKMASGDWICLLNADDEFFPGAVSKIMQAAKVDSDVICDNIVVHKGENTYIVEKSVLDYEKQMKKRQCMRHPGMFIRKSAYEKYGLYDTSYRCGMDRELIARMISKGAKFQYVDEITVLFTYGGVSSKRYLQYTLKEGVRTSLKYGARKRDVYLDYLCAYLTVRLSQIKRGLLKLLNRRR